MSSIQTFLKWQLKLMVRRANLLKWVSRLRGLVFYWMGVPHEIEFEVFRSFNGKPGLFVDIGANSGQSVFSFRIFNQSFDIVSFEPNPMQEPELQWIKKIFPKKFTFHLIGLGSERTTKVFFIPFVQGIPFTQEATFSLEALNAPITQDRIYSQSGCRVIETQKYNLVVRRFDEYKLLPTIIKMDVQGFELEVLKGMKETLQKAHPLLLVENSQQMDELKNYLSNFGYIPYVYHAKTRQFHWMSVERTELNAFFVHSSQLDDLRKNGVSAFNLKAVTFCI